MANKLAKPTGKVYSVPYHAIRNISSPEDLENGRRIYVGQIPIQSVLNFPTDENVRSYLLDADGRLARRESAVHKAIKDTLINHYGNFSVLNSGITLVASDVEVDEKAKILHLRYPSIINGAQTQGVIRDFYDEYEAHEEPVHMKCEIIVTDDEALIADISIARNFQNDVMSISIAGRKGQLNELEERVVGAFPELKLRKSETELPNGGYVDTEKLLQVIAALMPAELWMKAKDGDVPNKVYTYSQKSKCLKDFQDIFVRAKDSNSEDHEMARAAYEYYLDIAPSAYKFYNKWKAHQDFYGTKLRGLGRDAQGNITDVPDGIVFPIIAAYSVFVRRNDDGDWRLFIPRRFPDEEMIQAAKAVYMDMANHNPQTMGKNKACYTALHQITSIYRRLEIK